MSIADTLSEAIEQLTAPKYFTDEEVTALNRLVTIMDGFRCYLDTGFPGASAAVEDSRKKLLAAIVATKADDIWERQGQLHQAIEEDRKKLDSNLS